METVIKKTGERIAKKQDQGKDFKLKQNGKIRNPGEKYQIRPGYTDFEDPQKRIKPPSQNG